ncbi:hypothetical protein [Thalassobacillus cyri]|nr:hypothetical protein [Thalassobacillus cyri]
MSTIPFIIETSSEFPELGKYYEHKINFTTNSTKVEQLILTTFV